MESSIRNPGMLPDLYTKIAAGPGATLPSVGTPVMYGRGATLPGSNAPICGSYFVHVPKGGLQ